jgi:TPR repeat protein
MLMNLATFPSRLSVFLLLVLALMPCSASAGMNPLEVRLFEGFKVKAEAGDPEAQTALGGCYSKGIGVLVDHDKAAEWWLKAAEQGHAKAQVKVGTCYADGRGVSRSIDKAIEWYRKASDQDDANGQSNLAFFYERGIGVGKDEVEAFAYYTLAGRTDESARFSLSRLEPRMTSFARVLGVNRSKEILKEIEAKKAGK